MQLEPVKRYLASEASGPFFLFVGDADYTAVQGELRYMGLDAMSASDFCRDADRLPDLDALLDRLSGARVNTFVRGLGEHLGLAGGREAGRHLRRLKESSFGRTKVVLLLRGLAAQAKELQSDPRFDDRRYWVMGDGRCDLSFIVTPPSMKMEALPGYKAMLSSLENGRCGAITVNTGARLDSELFVVKKINSAYEGIRLMTVGFALPGSCGSESQWDELLAELNQNNGSFDKLFEKQGFGSALDSNFYSDISSGGYRSWLYFLFLKCRAGALSNGYLRYVLEKTDEFKSFEDNILHKIMEIHHTDKQFDAFYRERKVLIKDFPDSAIANFVVNNRRDVSESIYRLTDSSKPEREEIIAWLSRHGTDFQDFDVRKIYPLLADYLGRYVFKCPEIADLLTDYFEAYKRQKLSNTIEPDFSALVEDLAKSPRKFNRLPSRNEIIDGLDKPGCRMYWLDALGVEYLGLIEALAQRHGLSLSVSIGRADLPTLTEFNRRFFDDWQGPKSGSDDGLDAGIKHKRPSACDPQNKNLPVYIEEELGVIESVLKQAAVALRYGEYKRFVLVSDHGASRLAVLGSREEKYETDTKGEHSGRCCKAFSPHDLASAIEENGYLTLADYGRFKGGRISSREVHGGASLEEVVVPIVELSLRGNGVIIELAEKSVTADTKMGAVIELFINMAATDVCVILGGKRYAAEKEMKEANRYTVKLPDLKRAGKYEAEVYSGDNPIGRVTINAKGKSGSVNEDFDNLF